MAAALVGGAVGDGSARVISKYRGSRSSRQRPRRHLADLVRLAEALGGRLPPELAVIRDLLAAERRDALHTLRVEHVGGRAGVVALAASAH